MPIKKKSTDDSLSIWLDVNQWIFFLSLNLKKNSTSVPTQKCGWVKLIFLLMAFIYLRKKINIFINFFKIFYLFILFIYLFFVEWSIVDYQLCKPAQAQRFDELYLGKMSLDAKILLIFCIVHIKNCWKYETG